MQATRADEPIAAIVAFAADNADRIALRIMLKNVFCHRTAGIFHQSERWDFVFGTGNAIDVAHFGGTDDLHTWRADLVASNRRRPALHCLNLAVFAAISEVDDHADDQPANHAIPG